MSIRNSMLPAPTPSTSQKLFSGQGVPSATVAATFVGVVPVVALIAFLVVKLHSWLYCRRSSSIPSGTIAVKQENGDSDYLSIKPELGVGRTRAEMPGKEIVFEMSGAHEIRELSGSLEQGSPLCQLEVKGDCHLKELEAAV